MNTHTLLARAARTHTHPHSVQCNGGAQVCNHPAAARPPAFVADIIITTFPAQWLPNLCDVCVCAARFPAAIRACYRSSCRLPSRVSCACRQWTITVSGPPGALGQQPIMLAGGTAQLLRAAPGGSARLAHGVHQRGNGCRQAVNSTAKCCAAQRRSAWHAGDPGPPAPAPRSTRPPPPGNSRAAAAAYRRPSPDARSLATRTAA